MGDSLNRALRALDQGLLIVPNALATLRIEGPDRATWLNGLITANLATSKPGDALYGLAVGKTGKLLSELWLVLGDDCIHCAVPHDKVEAMRDHFDGYLIMEDAEVSVEPEQTWLIGFGPHSTDALAAARELGLVAGTTRRAEQAVLCATGLATRVTEFVATLSGAADQQRASVESWDHVRVRIGMGVLGVDFDESNYPQEAALESDAVSFDKGCYLGQEAVFMLQHRGHVKKRLVLLESTSRLFVGQEILDPQGTVQGQLTSVSGAAGESYGLGWVKYKNAKPGTELEVAGAKAVVTRGLDL